MNRLGIVRVDGNSNRCRRRDKTPLLVLIGVLVCLLLAAAPPTASAFAPLLGPASATPTSSGATLKATIYPYGLDTHYRFEYGATTAYGASVPVPEGDAGSEPYPYAVEVEDTISGLAANATYHYRLVASNASGPASSGDLQFTTTGPPPTVSDQAASEASGGFELKGTVNPNGSATSYQFEYGTTTGYGSKVPVPEGSAGSGNADVAVAQTVDGLLPNTIYHFRLVARHTGNFAATDDRTFMTPPAPPSAPTAAVSAPEATASGFKLKGAINPNNLESAYHFEFGTTTAYGTSLPEPDASVGSGANAVPVSQEVTGLLPSTTYHYRIVASNSEGPGVSGDQAFTTPPPKPTVASLPVSESAEGFTLNGSVNPNGGAATYHFEFGITEAYGQSIPASDVSAGSGSSAVAVSQLVKGLPPGVPYHYRIVAQNAGGTSVGVDQFFMTPAEPGAAPEKTNAITATLAPPLLASPSSGLSVRGATPKAGKATLSVEVPGAGTIVVSGRQVKAVRVNATRSGMVALTLKLTAAAKRALGKARGHRLAIKLTITFQPLGGSVSTTHKTIVFR
jgi:phosphodiesterase/alkaline phosphatase D-like protein